MLWTLFQQPLSRLRLQLSSVYSFSEQTLFPMRSLRLASLAIALLATGCSQTQELTGRPPPPPAPVVDAPDEHGAGFRDVTLEAVSILGTWYAVEVLEDEEATRDLEVGMMEMTLLVLPGGRSTLTGVDRREGSGRVSFTGIIEEQYLVRRHGGRWNAIAERPPPHPLRSAWAQHRVRAGWGVSDYVRYVIT